MPTAADLLAIENMRRLAADLRGFGEQVTEGQQQISGLQAQQQQQELLRSQRLEDIQQQQGFQVEQAGVGREFQAEQAQLGRESRLEIAKLPRGPETKINIQLRNEQRKADQTQRLTDLTKSGLLKVSEETGQPELNPEVAGTATGQAKFLKERILSLRDQTTEFSAEDEATVAKNLIRAANEAGVKSPGINQLRPKKDETKEQYLARLIGFRNSLIEREIAKRVGTARRRPNFGRPITGGGLGGPTFGPRTKESEERDINAIRDGVIKEFGGAIE